MMCPRYRRINGKIPCLELTCANPCNLPTVSYRQAGLWEQLSELKALPMTTVISTESPPPYI